MARRGQVLALPVGTSWEYRLVRLNEWVRERFWSIPVALVLAGVLIAVVVSRPDLLGPAARLGPRPRRPDPHGEHDAAR